MYMGVRLICGGAGWAGLHISSVICRQTKTQMQLHAQRIDIIRISDAYVKNGDVLIILVGAYISSISLQQLLNIRSF